MEKSGSLREETERPDRLRERFTLHAGGFVDPIFPWTIWPLTHWSLADQTDKKQIGVYGQALARVALWGESRQKFGVVGSTAGISSFGELPGETPAMFPGSPAGVYGVADSADANGVHGKSWSVGPDDSGVRAEGNGAAAGEGCFQSGTEPLVPFQIINPYLAGS